MASLYVHIPFCQHICSYCDFSKVYYYQQWVEQYLEALEKEIQDKQIDQSYDTIYIGGGTPSSLTLSQLERLLEILEPFSHHVQEYSIEVNPESMNQEKLSLFKKYHINRLSIGVQTLHDELLPHIQRKHTSKQALALMKEAQDMGFVDMNVDLMYGLPLQKLEDVLEDIKRLSQANVGHISVYSLILEDHTILKNQDYHPLDDEQDAYWYQKIHDCLIQEGYHHYEVSNYYRYKPSLHNLVYWHDQDYEGVGLSAHSLIHHHRYENTRSLTDYLQGKYLLCDTLLSKEDEAFEKIMMGLRLVEGISIQEYQQLFDIDLLLQYHDVIEKYQKYHMLEIVDGHLRTTFLGMNYLNSILVDFMDT